MTRSARWSAIALAIGLVTPTLKAEYYRGLLGRTLVFDLALRADELAELVKVGR